MESLDLLKLNWKHLDPEVRKQKLKSIEDQSVLTEIAKTDSSLSIRRDAVSRINDQTLLVEIAKTDSAKRRVCRDALSRIKNQNLLAEIATMASNEMISKKAIDRINDPALLAEIAKTVSDYDIREEALKRIKDKALLMDIEIKAVLKEIAETDPYGLRKWIKGYRRPEGVCQESSQEGWSIGTIDLK